MIQRRLYVCEDHFLYFQCQKRDRKTTMCEISHCHLFVFPVFTDETYVGKTALVVGWGTLKEDGKIKF